MIKRKKMKLGKYVGKYIRVDLTNGFYYEGYVNSADDNSISILDKNNKNVDIIIGSISFIREVEK